MLKQFRTILIISGLYNIIFSAPLMIPGISKGYLMQLNDMNVTLHLGGVPFVYAENPVSQFLINAAGLSLVLIGFIVLYASKNPVQRAGIVWLNIAGRLSFALVLAYYIFYEDLLRIVALFGIIDLIICGLFYYYLRKISTSL